MGRWSRRWTCGLGGPLWGWRTTVMTKELRCNSKLWIYLCVYIPIPTHGHELWVEPKGEGRGHRWPKWVSSGGCLGSALQMGWGAQTSRGSLEQNCCSLVSKRPPWSLPGGPGKRCWQKGGLEHPAKIPATATQLPDKWRKMDWWTLGQLDQLASLKWEHK